MPIGKISATAGKGADYSAGSVNIEHSTEQSKFGSHPSNSPNLRLLPIFLCRCEEGSTGI